MKQIKNQVVIQARLGSTRLPGKVLLPLAGEPVLSHVVKRCLHAFKVDKVVVATTDLSQDDAIETWCDVNGVPCVRGSSDDVLARYLLAAENFPCENIVRVTADCPLVDPGIIDALLFLHENEGADYTSNVMPPTFPVGLDAEVVRAETLRRVHVEASLQSHREHVTMFIRENPGLFKVANLAYSNLCEHFRLTLDRPEDYEVLRAVFAAFVDCPRPLSMYQVVDFLRNHPEIAGLNVKVDRFEGMRKSATQENRSLKL